MANLLGGVAHDGALELLHGAGDLVANGGLALLVVDAVAATEETAAAGGGGGAGCVVVGRHCESGM